MSEAAAHAALLEPYPEAIFTPLTPAEVATLVAAMVATGIPAPSDRLHAQWARHLYTVFEHECEDAKRAEPPHVWRCVD